MEDNFRDFFENNTDLIFILNTGGNVIEVNNAVCDMLGYTTVEMVGKSVLELYPSEFRKDVRRMLSEVIENKELNCSLPMIAKDNECFALDTRAFKGT